MDDDDDPLSAHCISSSILHLLFYRSYYFIIAFTNATTTPPTTTMIMPYLVRMHRVVFPSDFKTSQRQSRLYAVGHETDNKWTNVEKDLVVKRQRNSKIVGHAKTDGEIERERDGRERQRITNKPFD